VVTAAPASRVKAAVSKAAWWPWPLTFWPWKWCPSQTDRQTPDVRQHHRLMPPPIRGGGVINNATIATNQVTSARVFACVRARVRVYIIERRKKDRRCRSERQVVHCCDSPWTWHGVSSAADCLSDGIAATVSVRVCVAISPISGLYGLGKRAGKRTKAATWCTLIA